MHGGAVERNPPPPQAVAAAATQCVLPTSPAGGFELDELQ